MHDDLTKYQSSKVEMMGLHVRLILNLQDHARRIFLC